jgi:hypothetical protein
MARFAYIQWNRLTHRTTRKVNCVLPRTETALAEAFDRFVPGGYAAVRARRATPARKNVVDTSVSRIGGSIDYSSRVEDISLATSFDIGGVLDSIDGTPGDLATAPSDVEGLALAPLDAHEVARGGALSSPGTTSASSMLSRALPGTSSWCGWWQDNPTVLYCEDGETCHYNGDARWNCDNGCYVYVTALYELAMHCDDSQCAEGYEWDDFSHACIWADEGGGGGEEGGGGGSGGGGSGGGDPPAPPSAQVYCSPSAIDVTVSRTGEILCDVRYTPPDPLYTATVTGWTFAPDFKAGNFNLSPVTAGPQTTWQGLIVASGTVSAAVRFQLGTFDTTVTAGSAKVSVTPRGSFPAASDVALLSRPTYVDWQQGLSAADELAYGKAYSEGRSMPQSLLYPQTGPNAGYGIWADYHIGLDAKVEINFFQLSYHGIWYSLADEDPTDGSCSKEYIANDLWLIAVRHEGPDEDPLSHSYFLRQYIESILASIQERQEAIVQDQAAPPTMNEVLGYLYVVSEMQAAVLKTHTYSLMYPNCVIRTDAPAMPWHEFLSGAWRLFR